MAQKYASLPPSPAPIAPAPIKRENSFTPMDLSNEALLRRRIPAAFGSYEDMISRALISIGHPRGCKPKDIFQWMETNVPGLSDNFRASATQALKKGVDKGRFLRIESGWYTLNKEYEEPSGIRKRRDELEVMTTHSRKDSAETPGLMSISTATPTLDQRKRRGSEPFVQATAAATLASMGNIGNMNNMNTMNTMNSMNTMNNMNTMNSMNNMIQSTNNMIQSTSHHQQLHAAVQQQQQQQQQQQHQPSQHQSHHPSLMHNLPQSMQFAQHFPQHAAAQMMMQQNHLMPYGHSALHAAFAGKSFYRCLSRL